MDNGARINFTKRTLETLPIPKEKRAVWHDANTRGLGLLVQPTGHKSFFWFRKVNGAPTWQTIGAFPDLSVEQARSSADQFNSDIAEWKRKNYEGPSPFKRQDGFTLGSAFEKYMYVYRTKGMSEKRGPAPEKSLYDSQSWFDHYLKRLEKRKLDSIRRDDVKELHDDITEKHGPVVANRVVGLLRRVINFTIREELWHGQNPAETIRLNPENSRERFLMPDEMVRVQKALDKEANADLRDFVHLSLYVGQRKKNLLRMRWSEINQSVTGENIWIIPTTKNGEPHIVPLLPEAMKVLQERKRRADGLSPWVFPSKTSKSGHFVDMKRGWTRLRKDAKIPDVHIHDLRRTLGSWMAGGGASLPIIQRALGHETLAATQIYARLDLAPVRAQMSLAIQGMKKARNRNQRKGCKQKHLAA